MFSLRKEFKGSCTRIPFESLPLEHFVANDMQTQTLLTTCPAWITHVRNSAGCLLPEYDLISPRRHSMRVRCDWAHSW